MKTIKKLSALLLVTLILSSCNQKSNTVTSQKDYDKYLEIKDNKSRDFTQGEINFWQKNSMQLLTRLAI